MERHVQHSVFALQLTLSYMHARPLYLRPIPFAIGVMKRSSIEAALAHSQKSSLFPIAPFTPPVGIY